MSSKRSRMAVRAVHDAFACAVRQELEVEREFCLLPRRVALPSADQRQAVLTADLLSRETPLGNRVPLEFNVSVKVQRENRFTVAAHNELILNMTNMGMLTPDVAMELMLFDGKEQAIALMAKKRAALETAQPEEAPVTQGPIAEDLLAGAV